MKVNKLKISEYICKVLDSSFEDDDCSCGYESWDLDDELSRYYDAGFINGIYYVTQELKTLGILSNDGLHTDKIIRIKNYFDSIVE